jgi:hypothetical protein
MDAFDSIHPVPAAWLHDSDLAAFVPDYVRRLVDRHYAASTVRMYLYCVGNRQLCTVTLSRLGVFISHLINQM